MRDRIEHLLSIDSPGHPAAPSVREHYAAMAARFKAKVEPLIAKNELSALGLRLFAYVYAAMKREANTC